MTFLFLVAIGVAGITWELWDAARLDRKHGKLR